MPTTRAAVSRDLDRLIARLRAVVGRGAEELERRMGLSSGQLAALRSIDDGATGVGDVARACVTHMSNASRSVDALVRDGLVDRSTDPRDRRAVILTLTDDGTATRAEMDRHRDQVVTAGLSGLDAEERRTLVALMDRFLTGFEDALAAPGPPLDDAPPGDGQGHVGNGR